MNDIIKPRQRKKVSLKRQRRTFLDERREKRQRDMANKRMAQMREKFEATRGEAKKKLSKSSDMEDRHMNMPGRPEFTPPPEPPPEPKYEHGERVGVIHMADEAHIELYGYGTYKGEETPPKDLVEAGALFKHLGDKPNPKILLDNGKVIWGCECWFGYEDEVRRGIEVVKARGKRIVEVDIEEIRKGYQEKEEEKAVEKKLSEN